MAHNPHTVSLCSFPKCVSLICKNSSELLDTLDDKIKTREIVRGDIPMLTYHIIKGCNFDYLRLSRMLSSRLVIQLQIGSGGAKTFLCDKNNEHQIRGILNPEAFYSISAYQENNIPYNIHCIIADNQIEIFPPSQQLLELSEKIEYVGSTFDVQINRRVKNKFIEYSMRICQKLQKIGNRGVLGIDYIYANNELYFIEINPCFHGSTRQINALLKESYLPSIFDYNYRSFNNIEMPTTKAMNLSIFK